MAKALKKLSIHRPTKKIYTKEMFGHYLAGLIDGDGHISTINHIVISFNSRDKRDAVKLRSRLKYGTVRDVKDKNACNLVVSNPDGVLKVALLIKDKLKHPTKIEQYNTRLTKRFGLEKTSTSTLIDFDTPWFAGFFDADGHLRIYIVFRKHRSNPEIRLLGQIDQKKDVLLIQIKSYLGGGYVGYRKRNDTYYYSTTSFPVQYNLLKYFDNFSLQYENSYLRYTILRKAYLLVQTKEHLTPLGLVKIKKFHKKLKSMI